MKNFFKYTLATIVGGIITFFLAFLIVSGMIAGLASSVGSGDNSTVKVKDNTILKVEFSSAVVDREPSESFSRI